MTAEGDRSPGARAGGALQPCGFFAFRVPALPMSVLTEWSDGVDAPAAAAEDLPAAIERDHVGLRQRLGDIAGRQEVQAALSVASPDLLDAQRERGDDPGVEAALVRYVSRMSSRATPYGLFAACGMGTIGDHTSVELPDRATWRLHTQLDADYLDALVRDRSVALRDRLSFRPNDSLHLMAGRWRYVASRLDGLERSYYLLQVADSTHLQRVVEAARDTVTLADLTDAVAAAGVDTERATRYVHQLIDAQVLVPTLAVAITGPPPLDVLVADLASLGDDATVAVLRGVRDSLSALDGEGPQEMTGGHDRIATMLGQLPAPIKRSKLFHAQLTVPPCGATLSRSTVDEIARAVDLLRRLAPVRRPTELDAFRDAFRDRYDQREVPLLEALDEELGVGLGAVPDRPDPAPLLDGLRFPPRPGIDATVGGREHRLLHILHRAWTDGAREVALSSEDVDALSRDDAEPLPAAVGATAVLARTREGLRVVVTGAGGPSGARLLGRFCHSDPHLEEQVRAHLRAEEDLDPDAVHAEIVHLPSGRLVNVLARPVLRDYEIEWLGRSGAPRQRVISAEDLLLSLGVDDRLVLRSRTLGRRVLPRLTSAHNYNRHSPGVYRFLAALQGEGCTDGVGWSWFPFDRAPFTPRLRRGPVVLTLARWRLDGAELRELDGRDPVARWNAVAAWRVRRRVPRWVCLVEDDNVLAFDLDNVVSIDTLGRAVRKRDEAVLEELFPGPDELVASGPDGRRALELVVPLVRPVPRVSEPLAAAASGPRTFPPGTEWTYLKLYTGSATADRLLGDAVGPCARRLVEAGGADRWFFIRYEDPGFHLRVRVHGDPDRIRPALEALATRAIDEGLVHDAAFATYTREVERYGGDAGVLVAERLFHADSEAVVDLLDLFEQGNAGLDARWRIGLLGADRLLRDLGLDDTSCARIARRLRDAFEREMRADARLRKDVAAKLRAEREALDRLLQVTPDDDHPLVPGVRVLARRFERIAPLATELAGRSTAGVEALAVSFVHMWLNRLCRSESRRQEYVTYVLLDRLYAARAARAR